VKANKVLLAAMVAVAVAVAVLSARIAPAQEHGGGAEPPQPHGAAHAPGHGAQDAAAEHETPAPVLRPDMKNPWPGVMLIVIGFMFVAAIGAGIASAHAPPDEQPPATHSHDEPPGASHHHGSGGTINPEPGHGHAPDHGHH
jgi:hypothetical protein